MDPEIHYALSSKQRSAADGRQCLKSFAQKAEETNTVPSLLPWVVVAVLSSMILAKGRIALFQFQL